MKSQLIKENFRKLDNSQKKGSGTPVYTRYVNRFIGRLLAAIFATFNISPNTVSFFSAGLTFISFVLFLLMPSITILESSILVLVLYFSYALDSADGQLARLLSRQSKQGEWLDHFLDALKIPFSHGVAILFIISKIETITYTHLVFFLVIISLSSANFLSNILKSKLLVSKNSETTTMSHKTNIVRSVLTLPLDYGFFITIFLFAYEINIFSTIYYFYGIVLILYSILLFFKTWRELKQ